MIFFFYGPDSYRAKEKIEALKKIKDSDNLADIRSAEAALSQTIQKIGEAMYKNNPPQTGLIEHFEYLADTMCSAGSNLIMYNVPSRTGSNMLPKTTIRLAQHPRIIGTKEASGNLEQVRAIIEGTDPDSFRVVSGEDNIVADIF